jgi:hypothetical protein
MSVGVLDREQAMGRKKKAQPEGQPKRNDVPARIDAAILEDVKLMATIRKMSIGEYLSEIVGPIVRKQLEAEFARRVKKSPDR